MIRTMLLSGLAGTLLIGCASPPATTGGRGAEGPVAAATTTTRNAGCVSSASRLPASGECRDPGSSYSAEELRQTGQTTLGPALKMLDPAISSR